MKRAILILGERSAAIAGSIFLLVGFGAVVCAIAAIVTFFSGCVQPLPTGAERPPRESDLAIVDKVSAAWRAAGHPWTAQCRQERRDRLVVIRTDHVSVYCASRGPCCGSPEKQRACGCAVSQGGAGCAAGATTREADWVQPLSAAAQHWRIMIWLSQYEDEQTQRRVLAHEWVHALGTCSLEDPDRLHAHVEWWGTHGIEAAGW